jgi:hypothetical protein
MINLPDWLSALPPVCTDQNLRGWHGKNTGIPVFSGQYTPIRDIAVKNAIEK